MNTDYTLTHPPTRLDPQLIGVVHLPALPGDARAELSYQRCFELALTDARALIEGGVDGVIVENFGSAPFRKGTRVDPAPPHQVATLALIAAEIKRLSSAVKVGVNCLRNDAIAALGAAAAAGSDLIRVNVLSGAYVTDQGVIEGEAADVLEYRRRLQAPHIKIFADILVKHASPLSPLSPAQAALDTWKRGGADALIVSGTGTGAPVSASLLMDVQRAVECQVPVYLGSGLTLELVDELAPLASGAIVGTALKEGGVLNAPVSRDRVSALRDALSRYW